MAPSPAFTLGATASSPRPDGGTVFLFLDEIGELPLELQPVHLRAIETRTTRRGGMDNRGWPVLIEPLALKHDGRLSDRFNEHE